MYFNSASTYDTYVPEGSPTYMNKSGIEITKALAADSGLVQQIGRDTFAETFASGNTEANMKQYLEERFSRERIAAELNDPRSECYLAWQGGQLIGYIKLNTGQSQTEQVDADALEIERIYVQQQFHGKGAGQLLFNKALERAQQIAATFVWLGVWEKNERAIQFYKKNGFVEFGRHIFPLGADKQTDIMMKRQPR